MSSTLYLAGAFVGWAVLHSLLASMPIKKRVHLLLGSRLARTYRLLFNAVAAITLLPVLALALLLPDSTLYTVPRPWNWLMVCGQALSLTGLVWTFISTQPLDFVGLSQILSTKDSARGALQISGFYCHVRHPLYMFSLALLWLTPRMTANLLTLYLLTTLYFYVGSLHEERRLLIEFGDQYAAYQRRVPRLLPDLRPCRTEPDNTETARAFEPDRRCDDRNEQTGTSASL